MRGRYTTQSSVKLKKKKGIALSASDFSVQRSHPPILIKSCEKVEKLCTSCHSLHELFENSDLPPPHAAQWAVSASFQKVTFQSSFVFKASKARKMVRWRFLWNEWTCFCLLKKKTEKFSSCIGIWIRASFSTFAVSLELATTQILHWLCSSMKHFLRSIKTFFAANLEESFNILGKELASSESLKRRWSPQTSLAKAVGTAASMQLPLLQYM